MQNNIYKFNNDLLGEIIIVSDGNYITNILLNESNFNNDFVKNKDQVIEQAEAELKEYLNKKRKIFTVPLKPSGTDFQQRVWNGLLNIPYGQTCSYKDLANNINAPKSFRAVGNANGKNPIPIIIPCHRVINNNRKLGGYSSGLDIKIKLLKLENINFNNLNI